MDRLSKYVKHTGTQDTKHNNDLEARGQIQPQNSAAESSSKADKGTGEEEILPKPFTEMKGVSNIDQAARQSNDSNQFHVNAYKILELRKEGLLSRLPYVTTAEINDKSKSDSMARAIAVMQILWTTMQIIARAYRHLAVSQLEISVIAFAVCAIITYYLNWDKPKGVLVPFTLVKYSYNVPKRVGEVIGIDFSLDSTFLLISIRNKKPPGSPPSNASNYYGDWLTSRGSIISAVVFGSLHITAWNLTFPTELERTLWRATSIWCAVALPVSMLVLFCNVIFQRGGGCGLIIVTILCTLVGLGYVLARLYLMVEIFRSLCFLPPNAYISTWATNIPHIA